MPGHRHQSGHDQLHPRGPADHGEQGAGKSSRLIRRRGEGSTGEAVYGACKAGIIGFSRRSPGRWLATISTSTLSAPPHPHAPPRQHHRSTRRARIIESMTRAVPFAASESRGDAAAVAFFASDDAAFCTGQSSVSAAA
jgi:NAD(P)-dependent dehydrogenase (short-subunit alcohol dehydrogenase family)